MSKVNLHLTLTSKKNSINERKQNFIFVGKNVPWKDFLLYLSQYDFLSQVIFAFLLFMGMVMYANEVETKEK